MTIQETNPVLAPWLSESWQQLPLNNKEQFPQSVLFTGAEGIGRHDFILRLTQLLLCQNSLELANSHGKSENQDIACGQCQSCLLFSAHNHADFYQLHRLENKQAIGVDQIREVIDWVGLSSTLDQFKVLYIQEANKLSISASNALLKTLEEPPKNTIILLLSEYEKQLLPTIRSRCIHYSLPTPNGVQASDFLSQYFHQQQINISPEQIDILLKLTLNAPFSAIELNSSNKLEQRQAIISAITNIALKGLSPVHAVKDLMKTLKKEPVDYLLYCFYSLIIDINRAQLLSISDQVSTTNQLLNSDFQKEIIDLSKIINTHEKKTQLFSIFDELQSFFELTINPLNPQLLLESYLINWKKCCLNG